MLEKKSKLLLTITGPTAVGKTAVAVDIAQQLGTEIISCDSRQMYKEMSIGTAVPEIDELKAVPHHFIQTHTIFDPVNANSFGVNAHVKLADLFEKHKVVVMVGGSGLYIDAILKGIDDIPSPTPEIRAAIQEKIDNGQLQELQEQLRNIDPIYFSKIDIQNPRRILRGLEVYFSTGKPLSTFLTSTSIEREFSSAVIVLEMERETLYQRINARVDLMIANGLEKEALQLVANKDLTSLKTVGYQEFFEYFEGNCSYNEAVTRIKNNTRSYARKQETWFRRYESAFRLDSNKRKSIKKLVRELTTR